jgi:hypothetical protein
MLKNFAWHADVNGRPRLGSAAPTGWAESKIFRGSVKRFTLNYGPKGLESTLGRRSGSDDRKVAVGITRTFKGARAARKKEQPGSVDGEEHMGDEEFSELIALIYDAALDPDAWSVLLNQLADALSAQCGFIGSHNSSTNATAMTAPRTDPEYLRCYTEYWASRAFIWKGLAKTAGRHGHGSGNDRLPRRVLPHRFLQ